MQQSSHKLAFTSTAPTEHRINSSQIECHKECKSRPSFLASFGLPIRRTGKRDPTVNGDSAYNLAAPQLTPQRLAAERNMGMLEAGEREPEVVEPMNERSAGDRDPQRARICEIGEAELAGLVLLWKIAYCSGPLSARHALMRRSKRA